MSRYSEYTGQQDPLNQIYVTSDVKEFMPLMLFLTCVRMLPDFVYDANLVALVRRKSSVEVDGAPLVGIITILKQLNPAFTLKFLAYLGEYINWKGDNAKVQQAEKAGRPPRCRSSSQRSGVVAPLYVSPARLRHVVGEECPSRRARWSRDQPDGVPVSRPATVCHWGGNAVG